MMYEYLLSYAYKVSLLATALTIAWGQSIKTEKEDELHEGSNFLYSTFQPVPRDRNLKKLY